MALIKCPECEKRVSTEAAICPHCGFGISTINVQETIEKQSKKSKDNLICLLVIVIFVVALIGGTAYYNYANTSYTRAQKRFEDLSGNN